MKTSRISSSQQNKQGFNAKPRPDIRDDLDSRSRLERRYVGDKSKKGDREPAQEAGDRNLD